MTAPLAQADLLERHIPLQGTYNVRDIGGYPAGEGLTTRWRTVIRADGLDRLGEDGHRFLADIGVRTVVDLRDDHEAEAAPDNLGPVGARLLRAPLLGRDGPWVDRPGRGELTQMYLDVVRHRGDAIGSVLRSLAQPGALPAVVHCRGGSDRTGLVVALTLSLLGVPDDVVVADYSATSYFLERAEREHAIPESPEERLLGPVADPCLAAEALRVIRSEFGGAARYLRLHGMSGADLDRLRFELTAPSTSKGATHG